MLIIQWATRQVMAIRENRSGGEERTIEREVERKGEKRQYEGERVERRGAREDEMERQGRGEGGS